MVEWSNGRCIIADQQSHINPEPKWSYIIHNGLDSVSQSQSMWGLLVRNLYRATSDIETRWGAQHTTVAYVKCGRLKKIISRLYAYILLLCTLSAHCSALCQVIVNWILIGSRSTSLRPSSIHSEGNNAIEPYIRVYNNMDIRTVNNNVLCLLLQAIVGVQGMHEETWMHR